MAHAVPTDGRVFWINTAASIPSGWSRDTDFDDVYLQGVTDDSRGTGGGVHIHTQNHALIGVAHTHSVSGASVTPGFTMTRKSNIFGSTVSALTHGHNASTSASTTITYADDSTSLSSFEADPPFVRAIIIKPDTGDKLIPDGAFCFTDQAEAPTGFDITGSGGTTDYSEKFILGALAAGDGGGTGGSTTHTHDDISHDHPDNLHGHVFANAGLATSSSKVQSAVTANVLERIHHEVSLYSETLSDVSTEDVVVDAGSSEPAYMNLLGIENTSGADALPAGVIVGYTGTIASVPDQWEHYARIGARQVRIVKNANEVGHTGGSNTHDHNLQAHQHTHAGSHDHVEAEEEFEASASEIGTPTVTLPDTTKSHTHVWTIGSTQPTCQSTGAFSCDSADGRAAYQELIFIKYEPYSTRIRGGLIKGGAVAA